VHAISDVGSEAAYLAKDPVVTLPAWNILFHSTGNLRPPNGGGGPVNENQAALGVLLLQVEGLHSVEWKPTWKVENTLGVVLLLVLVGGGVVVGGRGVGHYL